MSTGDSSKNGSAAVADFSFLGPSFLLREGNDQPSTRRTTLLNAPFNLTESQTGALLNQAKYCKKCRCQKGNEPCFHCIESDYRCPVSCCEDSNKALPSTDPKKDATEAKQTLKISDKEASSGSRILQEPTENLNVPKYEEEEDAYKHITQCERCPCVKHEASCMECKVYDMKCTFTKNRLCSCCAIYQKVSTGRKRSVILR